MCRNDLPTKNRFTAAVTAAPCRHQTISALRRMRKLAGCGAILASLVVAAPAAGAAGGSTPSLPGNLKPPALKIGGTKLVPVKGPAGVSAQQRAPRSVNNRLSTIARRRAGRVPRTARAAGTNTWDFWMWTDDGAFYGAHMYTNWQWLYYTGTGTYFVMQRQWICNPNCGPLQTYQLWEFKNGAWINWGLNYG